MIAQHNVDFRKSFDGLLGEAYAMELNPYAGECIIFIHRSWRAMKILGGDEYGLWLLARRFEGGAIAKRFPFLSNPAFVEITQAELAFLLEGVSYQINKRPHKINKHTRKQS